MILSVTVESFLNFEGQIIAEVSSTEDKGKFTILFGRNGCGKSSLVTAIIWCLFDQKSSKKLINNQDLSKGVTQCSVIVRLYSQNETIDVKKTYKIRGNVVSYQATYHSANHGTSSNISPVTLTNEEEIRSVLQNKFNVNTASIDSVYCAQSSENLQSLKNPLELLRFVETCIGTITLKQEYELLQAQVQQKTDNIQAVVSKSEINTTAVTLLLPKMQQAIKYVKDSLKLNKAFIAMYTSLVASLTITLHDNAVEKVLLVHSLETTLEEKRQQESILVASNTQFDQCGIECGKSKKLVDQVTRIKKKLERDLNSENELMAETNATIAKLKKKHKYTLGQLAAVQEKLEVNSNEIKELGTELRCNQQLRDEVQAALTQFLDTDVSAVKRENSIIRSIKERSETAGLQSLVKSLETKKALRDEWSVANAECVRSIEALEDEIASLSSHLKSKEVEAKSVAREIIECERQTIEINKGIIELRQQLQTRNHSIFLTNTCVKMNKLMAALTVDCVILCNVVLPKNTQFTQAVIASIGYNRLLTTLIVKTRQVALDIVAVAKKLGISGILVEILDEYPSGSKSNSSQELPPTFSLICDCLTFLDKRVIPLFTHKYRDTYVFNGNAQDMLAVFHRMTGGSRCSFASLDGCRVKPGGEIATSIQHNDVWPIVSAECKSSTASVKDVEAELARRYQVESENSLRMEDVSVRHSHLTSEIAEVKQVINNKVDAKNVGLKRMIAASKCAQVQSEIDSLETSITNVSNSISELANQESARMQILTSHPVYSEINKLLKKQLLAHNSIDKQTLRLKIVTADNAYLQKRNSDLGNCIETVMLQLNTSNQSHNEAMTSRSDIEKKLDEVTENFSAQTNKHESAMKEFREMKEKRAVAESAIRKLEFSAQLLQQDIKAVGKKSDTTKKSIEITQAKLEECQHAMTELKSCALLVFHRRVVDSYRCSKRKFQKVRDDAGDGLDKHELAKKEDEEEEEEEDDKDSDNDQDIVFDDDENEDELDAEPVTVVDNDDSRKLHEKQLLLRQKVLSNSEMASWKSVYETYNSYCHQQVAARNQIKEIQGDIKVLLGKMHDIQSKRFERISSSLKDISSSLTTIYKTLVFESDCYLSYSNIMSILYDEGVEILSSHSNQHYKEIRHLSGGQQSAVSLSLLFALHSCFPSSFFIFDEVDASLDSRTVGKLGVMIKELSLKYSTSNFLVVSHRSEMIEMATRILGLYHANNKPQVISKVF